MKKPEIFKPNINVDNNKKTYYSCSDNNFDTFREDVENPREFLNNLVKSKEYMFSKRVVIKTKYKTYDTNIAGIIGNRVITLDNDSININDIENIYEK